MSSALQSPTQSDDDFHALATPTSSSPTQQQQDNNQTQDLPDYTADPRLSPLEAAVLTEYALLKQNLDALSDGLAALASQPSAGIGDGLRALERKTGLVCTALKASVYGLLLQQGMDGGEAAAAAGDEEGDESTIVG